MKRRSTHYTEFEMKVGEWLYLCVAYRNSGGMQHCCGCAIDYIMRTLDGATALLNSLRAIPSRVSIPATSHRHFPSLARCLGRIFAHAYGGVPSPPRRVLYIREPLPYDAHGPYLSQRHSAS